MKRRLLLAIPIALGAALAWLEPGVEPPRPVANPPPREAGPAPLQPPAADAAAADAAPAMPVPEEPAPSIASVADAPTTLLSDLARLDARAAAGDRDAAWQAYRAVQKCRERLAQDRYVRQVEDAAPESPLAAFRRDLAGALDSVQSRYCAGGEAFGAAAVFERLLRLAEAGDLAAQLQFALDPPIYRRRALAELDLILRYRERAPELLQRALMAGSLQALAALLDAHTPAPHKRVSDYSSHSSGPERPDPALGAVAYRQRLSLSTGWRELPHRQILRPDPAQAYLLAIACQRVCTDGVPLERAGRAIALIEATLAAKERLRLHSQADQLVLDAFSGRVEEPKVTPGAWWNTP